MLLGLTGAAFFAGLDAVTGAVGSAALCARVGIEAAALAVRARIVPAVSHGEHYAGYRREFLERI